MPNNIGLGNPNPNTNPNHGKKIWTNTSPNTNIESKLWTIKKRIGCINVKNSSF
jgi:hypothetical protein